MTLVYLDSSALVKLVVAEPESTVLAVREDLATVVTYDRRLRETAELVHLEVEAPA